MTSQVGTTSSQVLFAFPNNGAVGHNWFGNHIIQGAYVS